MRRPVPLLAVIALLVFAPASAAASLPAGFIGLSPQGTLHPSDFQLMQQAGVRSVRLPMFWSAIQPENPSLAKPNWSEFDRDVAMAAEHRITVFPFLCATPSWAAGEGIQEPIETPLQRRSWAKFLRAAVAHYGPEGSFWEENPEIPLLPIRSWEIWDEENLITFAYHPNPSRFARLLRLSGRILHEAEPGSKVILGGLFGDPLQTPPNVASAEFLARVYRAPGIKQYFDGVGLHPYVARPGEIRPEVEALRRVMQINGDTSTPLDITELGWGSAKGPTRWEVGPYGQAEDLDNAFSMLAAHRLQWRIGGIWWFTWANMSGACHNFCDSAGLLTAQREAKPSWYQFNAWTGGDPNTVPRAEVFAR
jgi:hypothetical protein